MSLKNKRYVTVADKALRVLAACGKAPVVLRAMNMQEVAAVAALCDVGGNLVSDGREQFRLLMVDHYERLKATSEEFDESPST